MNRISVTTNQLVSLGTLFRQFSLGPPLKNSFGAILPYISRCAAASLLLLLLPMDISGDAAAAARRWWAAVAAAATTVAAAAFLIENSRGPPLSLASPFRFFAIFLNIHPRHERPFGRGGGG